MLKNSLVKIIRPRKIGLNMNKRISKFSFDNAELKTALSSLKACASGIVSAERTLAIAV